MFVPPTRVFDRPLAPNQQLETGACVLLITALNLLKSTTIISICHSRIGVRKTVFWRRAVSWGVSAPACKCLCSSLLFTLAQVGHICSFCPVRTRAGWDQLNLLAPLSQNGHLPQLLPHDPSFRREAGEARKRLLMARTSHRECKLWNFDTWRRATMGA